ncbi:MAG: hypothetical protein NTW78_08670 [Campylobacterales bacterium]|nr:hypothetical protein [Campylobacterales bacterium]
MQKIIYSFILYFLCVNSLDAQEPTMAILKSIATNSRQDFNIQNYDFYCEPYGVISLEKMYSNSQNGSKCRESIDGFYKKHPDLKYFTQGILKTEQMYHVEFKDMKCVIYARGQKSLSELLLENGLAVNKRTFNDEEFNFIFKKAEINAKLLKRGMWSEKIDKECATELSKD